MGHHRLLGLERWTRAQNAGSGRAEGHAPGLDKPSPWVEVAHPRRRWALGDTTCAACACAAGGRGSTVGTAAATLVLGAVAAVATGVAAGGAASAGGRGPWPEEPP